MRLAFFSDIHGNLPALESIINDINSENIDYTVFMGDAIGLGPKPYECLKLMLESNIYFNYGNHEQYALEGIENFDLEGMEKEIFSHHLWVKEQVKDIISEIENDPKVDEDMLLKFNKKQFYLCHYANKNGVFLRPKLEEVDIEYLKEIFSEKYDYVFYGHNHEYSYLQSSKTKYICLGSSGCVKDDNTFYTIVNIDDKIEINTKYIKYNRDKFIEDFNNANYPLKDILGEMFFGISSIL